MESRPLISVIMPFLNTEKFIKESIESVISQTYKNWELVLVDDGSDDQSTEIAKNYAKLKSDKIIYLEHDEHRNLGPSISRNLGIRNSNGKYIGFLDSDDIWLPEKLEKNLEILQANPEADLLYGATVYWHSWTGHPEDEEKDKVWNNFGFDSNRLITPPELLIAQLIVLNSVPGLNSFLFKKQIIEDVGGFEESFNFIFTDQAFYSKIFHVAKIYITDGCWDKYRQYPGSSCHVAKKRGVADKIHWQFLEWLEGYLLEKSEKRKDVWNAINLKKKILRTEINAKRWKSRFNKKNDEVVKLQNRINNLNRQLKKHDQISYLIYKLCKSIINRTTKGVSSIIDKIDTKR